MRKMFSIFLCMIITMGAGYSGKLPNITAEFAYKSNKPATSYPPYTENKDENVTLTPSPRENKTYIEIIAKKHKTLEYTEDVNKIITILEKLKTCIEEEQ